MTAKNVQETIRAAEDWLPEAPRPLVRELPPADPFPFDVLGDVLEGAALAVQDYTQAPTAICGQSVLAAATLAVQGHADIKLPTGQSRPVSGYFVTVAATGERKTACDTHALQPIRKREEHLRQQYDIDFPNWQNMKDSWDKQRQQILGNKSEFPTIQAKTQALSDLGSAPMEPLIPMLTCPEPTFEGMCRLLASGPPSVGIFSGEGGQFLGGYGMSKDHKLKTSAALSSTWDGDPIKRVRAGDGVVTLPGRRVALHLMAQPEVSARLLSDRDLEDQGILSRLLVTAPETAAGTRMWRDPRPESHDSLILYNSTLLSILEKPLPLVEGKSNEVSPRSVSLSPAAREKWISFANHIESLIAPGGELEPIRGLANKLPEHAARLAAVLSLIEEIQSGEVSNNHVAAGIELAQHYASEALRLFSARSVSDELRLAQRLLEWLENKWTEPLIALPSIYQLGPNAIRDKRTAARIVDILEDHGWLIPIEGSATVAGKSRRDVWRIVRGAKQ